MLLLQKVCNLYQQNWLDLSHRMIPLRFENARPLTRHLGYLFDHGLIEWTGEGTPIPTMRGLELAEAIEAGTTLVQFFFGRHN